MLHDGPPAEGQGGPEILDPRRAWDRALVESMRAAATTIAERLTVPDDVVEAALADAIRRASEAGRWAAVEALARELEARRRARAGVTELARVRADKRGMPR